ncbi:MAG: hypothetical protein R3C13_14595 [Hyphomonas sp.]|uniref:hypothetical protein n=1 Tax=Hyphomonas sp. TaxID=87 RepID=UPI0035277088
MLNNPGLSGLLAAALLLVCGTAPASAETALIDRFDPAIVTAIAAEKGWAAETLPAVSGTIRVRLTGPSGISFMMQGHDCETGTCRQALVRARLTPKTVPDAPNEMPDYWSSNSGPVSAAWTGENYTLHYQIIFTGGVTRANLSALLDRIDSNTDSLRWLVAP